MNNTKSIVLSIVISFIIFIAIFNAFLNPNREFLIAFFGNNIIAKLCVALVFYLITIVVFYFLLFIFNRARNKGGLKKSQGGYKEVADFTKIYFIVILFQIIIGLIFS